MSRYTSKALAWTALALGIWMAAPGTANAHGGPGVRGSVTIQIGSPRSEEAPPVHERVIEHHDHDHWPRRERVTYVRYVERRPCPPPGWNRRHWRGHGHGHGPRDWHR